MKHIQLAPARGTFPKSKTRFKAILFETICYMLILLFSYTAWNKLADYASFSKAFSQTFLKATLSPVAAALILTAEVATALLLIIPKTRKAGLLAAGTLLTLFTMYLAISLISGSTMPCSCGGFFNQMSWSSHIWFNLILLAISLFGIHIQPEK